MMTEELGPDFEMLAPAPAARRGTRWLAAAGAAVVLAGGGVASYAALAGSDPGSDSPKAAVAKVLDDLAHRDLLGVIDDLVPGERAAVRSAVTDDVASLERLGVFKKGTDLSSVSGVSFAARGLRYAAPVKITDSVRIVPITAGTFDVSGSLARLPLTQRLVGLTKNPTSSHSTVKTVSADQPVRLAAQRVGGRWYASAFYSVADAAAHQQVPTAGDHVAAKGAASADAAVRSLVTDLVGGKVREAIALISPDELGALHDYGGLLDHGARTGGLPISITSLKTATKAVDGGTDVRITQLDGTVAGQQVTIAAAGNCLKITSPLFNRNACGADIVTAVGGMLRARSCASGFSYGSHGSSAYRSKLHITYDRPGSCAPPTFTAAQKAALNHLVTGLLGSGIVTTQIDGTWYVAPVRTLAHASTTTLSALQGDDLFALLSLLP